jgi:hypothetical protein
MLEQYVHISNAPSRMFVDLALPEFLNILLEASNYCDGRGTRLLEILGWIKLQECTEIWYPLARCDGAF